VRLVDHGAWTWFHNPRAVFHRGRRRRTYFTWSWNGIWVGSYDHDSGETHRHRLLETTQNDHNVAALGVRPDGRLLVCYSPHNGTMRSVVAEFPEDVSRWEDPVVIREERATYPNLVFLAAEDRWVLVYRGGPTGDWPLWFRSSDDGGRTWSAETLLFRNGAHRPYPQVVADGVDQIHFSVTDGHPNAVPDNSVYHLRYDAGTWRDSTGTALGAPPFTPEHLTRVYDGSAEAGRAWCWDIALRADGAPVMAFATIRSELDHRYQYATLQSGTWSVNEITPAGRKIYEDKGEPEYSAGLTLDHRDPRRVLLSREVEPGRWELESWRTADLGRTWTATPVTSRSRAAPAKHFRPTAVHGDGPFEALWCSGDYRTYRDFSSAVLALPRRWRWRARLDLLTRLRRSAPMSHSSPR